MIILAMSLDLLKRHDEMTLVVQPVKHSPEQLPYDKNVSFSYSPH